MLTAAPFSGDGAIVAAATGQTHKCRRLVVGNATAGIITFTSGTGPGTTLLEMFVPANTSIELGDGIQDLLETAAGEGLYVTAGGGTVKGTAYYTST